MPTLPIVRLYLFSKAFSDLITTYCAQFVYAPGHSRFSTAFIKVNLVLDELMALDSTQEMGIVLPDGWQGILDADVLEVETMWEDARHQVAAFLNSVKRAYIRAGEPPLMVDAADKELLDEVCAACEAYSRDVNSGWQRKLAEVAESSRHPESSDPKPAPTAVNITTIGNIVNTHSGQVEIASAQQATATDFRDVMALVESLRSLANQFGLKEADEKHLLESAQSLAVEIKSNSPKRGAMTECLKSVRNILEGATGSVLASAFAQAVQAILLRL